MLSAWHNWYNCDATKKEFDLDDGKAKAAI